MLCYRSVGGPVAAHPSIQGLPLTTGHCSEELWSKRAMKAVAFLAKYFSHRAESDASCLAPGLVLCTQGPGTTWSPLSLSWSTRLKTKAPQYQSWMILDSSKDRKLPSFLLHFVLSLTFPQAEVLDGKSETPPVTLGCLLPRSLFGDGGSPGLMERLFMSPWSAQKKNPTGWEVFPTDMQVLLTYGNVAVGFSLIFQHLCVFLSTPWLCPVKYQGLCRVWLGERDCGSPLHHILHLCLELQLEMDTTIFNSYWLITKIKNRCKIEP